MVFNGVAHPHDELVRDHKDQDVGSFHRLSQVWNSQLDDERRNMVKHSDHMATSNRQNTVCDFCWSSKSVLRLTTLGGSLCPGRYFTFSWSVLMISVSLRPFTISSKTHMFTVVSNLSYLAALAPTILAMAEPLWTWRHTTIILASTRRQGELTVVQEKKCPNEFHSGLGNILISDLVPQSN